MSASAAVAKTTVTPRKPISRPASNFTSIPNEVIDKALRVLEGTELKCFLVIARETFGWGKATAKISIKRFEELTGAAPRTVTEAHEALRKMGMIAGSARSKQFSINLEPRQWRLDRSEWELARRVEEPEAIEPEPDADDAELAAGPAKATKCGVCGKPAAELLAEHEAACRASQNGQAAQAKSAVHRRKEPEPAQEKSAVHRRFPEPRHRVSSKLGTHTGNDMDNLRQAVAGKPTVAPENATVLKAYLDRKWLPLIKEPVSTPLLKLAATAAADTPEAWYAASLEEIEVKRHGYISRIGWAVIPKLLQNAAAAWKQMSASQQREFLSGQSGKSTSAEEIAAARERMRRERR